MEAPNDITYLRHQLSFLMDAHKDPIKDNGLQISFDALKDELDYIIQCDKENDIAEGNIPDDGYDYSEHKQTIKDVL